MMKSKYADVAVRAERDLGKEIQVQGKAIETFGPESLIRGIGKPQLGFNSPIAFSHTVGTGAGKAEIVKLGDPEGLVAQAGGITATNYTSGQPWTNAQLNALLRNGMTVGLVNYEVDNVAQFGQSIQYASTNHGGSYTARPLGNQVNASKRNTQQNALLLTIDFTGQGIVLDTFNCLFITVGVGRTISQWNMVPAAVVS
jgi:hypothetical protein